MQDTERRERARLEAVAKVRHEKLKEWREVALSERERCNRLEHERDALRSALEDLVGEQNGPPLLRRQKHWKEAMAKARRALIIAPEGRSSDDEETDGTHGEKCEGGSVECVADGD